MRSPDCLRTKANVHRAWLHIALASTDARHTPSPCSPDNLLEDWTVFWVLPHEPAAALGEEHVSSVTHVMPVRADPARAKPRLSSREDVHHHSHVAKEGHGIEQFLAQRQVSGRPSIS